MELKEFVNKVILNIVNAVDEAREKSVRNISLRSSKDNRTIEFDVAVSVENTDRKEGKAGIKVLEFIEGGGNIEKGSKNSTVTRIKFGVFVDTWTKEEQRKFNREQERLNSNNLNPAI